MLTKALSVSVLKAGFYQLKRLCWDVLVTEVNLPGEKPLCAQCYRSHWYTLLWHCAPQREVSPYCFTCTSVYINLIALIGHTFPWALSDVLKRGLKEQSKPVPTFQVPLTPDKSEDCFSVTAVEQCLSHQPIWVQDFRCYQAFVAGWWVSGVCSNLCWAGTTLERGRRLWFESQVGLWAAALWVPGAEVSLLS